MPDLHFVEISKDRKVYIGERGQNRIQVFTTEGKWLQDIDVSPNSPASRGECGGLNATPLAAPGLQLFNRSICGTIYKMVISKDPQQKYLFVADAHNDAERDWDRFEGQYLRGRSGQRQTHPEIRSGPDRRALAFAQAIQSGRQGRDPQIRKECRQHARVEGPIAVVRHRADPRRTDD